MPSREGHLKRRWGDVSDEATSELGLKVEQCLDKREQDLERLPGRQEQQEPRLRGRKINTRHMKGERLAQSLPCRLGPGLDSTRFRLERCGLTAVGIVQKRRGGDVVQVGGDGA